MLIHVVLCVCVCLSGIDVNNVLTKWSRDITLYGSLNHKGYTDAFPTWCHSLGTLLIPIVSLVYICQLNRTGTNYLLFAERRDCSAKVLNFIWVYFNFSSKKDPVGPLHADLQNSFFSWDFHQPVCDKDPKRAKNIIFGGSRNDE